jgi:hypothetical protein
MITRDDMAAKEEGEAGLRIAGSRHQETLQTMRESKVKFVKHEIRMMCVL